MHAERGNAARPSKIWSPAKSFIDRSAATSASPTSASTRTGSRIRSRWRISTRSAASRGIPTRRPQNIAAEWTQLTFGNDPTVVSDDHRPATRVVAHLRKLHRPARHADAHRHHRQPLRTRTSNHPKKTAGASGIAPTKRESAWTAPSRPAPATSANIARPSQKFTNRSRRLPDELLLFFHHVPYTYKLHSGKTVIQYIYDSHYEGAAEVAEFVDQWKSLQGHVDTQRFNDVLARLEYQAGHAIVWRDAICNYFLKKSGIADDARPRRTFPQSHRSRSRCNSKATQPVDVTPWENASRRQSCRLQAMRKVAAPVVQIHRQGRELHASRSSTSIRKTASQNFAFLLNGQTIAQWTAARSAPRHKNRRRRRHAPHDRQHRPAPRRSNSHRRHARSPTNPPRSITSKLSRQTMLRFVCRIL